MSGSGGDLAGPKQVFKADLGVVPAPPRAGAPAVLAQTAGADGAFLAHPLQQLRHIAALFAREFGEVLVKALAARGIGHAPAQERVQGKGQEACLVRPVFEQRPFTGRKGAGIEGGVVVRAGARKKRQVMGAHQDVDGVHLQQVEAVDDGGEALPRRLALAPRTGCQAGGRQGEAAGFLARNALWRSHQMQRPPSTSRQTPVMKSASSEAR